MNAWLLTNIPSPYQTELLQSVASCGQGELDVRFMRRHYRDAPTQIGNANVAYLPAFGLSRTRDELCLHPRAIRECWTGRWSAYVLSGTIASPTLLLCCFVLTIRRQPWILWLERPHPKAKDAPWGPAILYRGPLRWARNCVMRWLLRNCSALIAMGKLASQEYIALGVSPTKVYSLPYCCNSDRFEVNNDAASIREFRQSIDLSDQVLLLFSGQLIERKGINQLIALFENLASLREGLGFIILGDGPLRPVVEAFRDRSKCKVLVPGHLPQDALPHWFAAADIFVFPSRHDGWGVVINEACAAGLPCIASSQTGAAADLITAGDNGFVIDCNDGNGWIAAALTLIDDANLRRRMGSVSKRVAAANSANVGADLFWKCIAEEAKSKP